MGATPNLNLTINTPTDASAVLFDDWWYDQNGNISSNATKIDDWAGLVSGSITNLSGSVTAISGSLVTGGNFHDHVGGDGGEITEYALSFGDVTVNDVSSLKHGLMPKLNNNSSYFIDGTGTWDTIKDADLVTSDVTTNNASTTKHGFLVKLPNSSASFIDGTGAWDTIKDSDLVLSDIVTNNASTAAHGFLAKLPNSSASFIDGTGAWDTIKDADLVTSDVTTNNASTTKHGFLSKLPNKASQFLDGTGTWVDNTAPNGWITDSDTWVYASATSFTVNSKDVTARFPKGTKIKLTQTTDKYFYVTSSTYSAPNTIVTITGGTDYTLANATITSPNYSFVATPQGFPTMFNFTATVNGSGGSAGTYAEDNSVAWFKLDGNLCTATVTKRITNKGSWSGDLQIARPVTKVAEPYISLNGFVVAQGGITYKGILQSDSSSLFIFASAVATSRLGWAGLAVNDWVYINATYRI